MTPSGVHEVRGHVPAVGPEAFLGLCGGGPRGFWAAGERWIAHAGLAGLARVADGPEGGDPAEATALGRSRFRLVQSQAARVFDGIAAPAGRPPRLFGGFSFAAGPRRDRAWAAFPSALFHLPKVEIEHKPAERICSLAARASTRRAARRLWRWWADSLERSALGSPTLPRPLAGLLTDRTGTDQAGAGGPEAAGAGTGNGLPVDGGASARVGLGLGPAAWTGMVEGALARIRAGQAEKIVLSRTLDAAPSPAVDGAEVAVALWRENHGSHVFLFEPAPGDAVVGAAPETIATLAGGVVRATAVAGSTGVGRNSVETAQLAADLFASAKDRAEHDLVVRDVVRRLGALGCRIRRDVEPHVLALARIQHLETKIAGPAPPGTSILRILASLHPTPAVCGTPRDVAMSAILEEEALDRGWYAGPVGWFDAAGDGVFVPALRSAVRFGGRWRLFAGAGIVARSDPALEWDETEMKFAPVLRAIASVPVGGRAKRRAARVRGD